MNQSPHQINLSIPTGDPLLPVSVTGDEVIQRLKNSPEQFRSEKMYSLISHLSVLGCSEQTRADIENLLKGLEVISWNEPPSDMAIGAGAREKFGELQVQLISMSSSERAQLTELANLLSELEGTFRDQKALSSAPYVSALWEQIKIKEVSISKLLSFLKQLKDRLAQQEVNLSPLQDRLVSADGLVRPGVIEVFLQGELAKKKIPSSSLVMVAIVLTVLSAVVFWPGKKDATDQQTGREIKLNQLKSSPEYYNYMQLIQSTREILDRWKKNQSLGTQTFDVGDDALKGMTVRMLRPNDNVYGRNDLAVPSQLIVQESDKISAMNGMEEMLEKLSEDYVDTSLVVRTIAAEKDGCLEINTYTESGSRISLLSYDSWNERQGQARRAVVFGGNGGAFALIDHSLGPIPVLWTKKSGRVWFPVQGNNVTIVSMPADKDLFQLLKSSRFVPFLQKWVEALEKPLKNERRIYELPPINATSYHQPLQMYAFGQQFLTIYHRLDDRGTSPVVVRPVGDGMVMQQVFDRIIEKPIVMPSLCFHEALDSSDPDATKYFLMFFQLIQNRFSQLEADFSWYLRSSPVNTIYTGDPVIQRVYMKDHTLEKMNGDTSSDYYSAAVDLKEPLFEIFSDIRIIMETDGKASITFHHERLGHLYAKLDCTRFHIDAPLLTFFDGVDFRTLPVADTRIVGENSVPELRSWFCQQNIPKILRAVFETLKRELRIQGFSRVPDELRTRLSNSISVNFFSAHELKREAITGELPLESDYQQIVDKMQSQSAKKTWDKHKKFLISVGHYHLLCMIIQEPDIVKRRRKMRALLKKVALEVQSLAKECKIELDAYRSENPEGEQVPLGLSERLKKQHIDLDEMIFLEFFYKRFMCLQTVDLSKIFVCNAE